MWKEAKLGMYMKKCRSSSKRHFFSICIFLKTFFLGEGLLCIAINIASLSIEQEHGGGSSVISLTHRSEKMMYSCLGHQGGGMPFMLCNSWAADKVKNMVSNLPS